MTRARQGDKEAFDQVNTLINEKMHPGTSAGRVGEGSKVSISGRLFGD